MTTAIKTAKTVKVIARIEFKSDSKKVCYIVRSSDGDGQYTTCLHDGRACSCTCKATVRCYHMVQCEAKEAAHREAAETARCNRELAFASY